MKRRPLSSYTPPRILVLASLGYGFGPMACLPGYVLSDTGPPMVYPQPDIEVDPREVDFGEVDPEAFAEVLQAIEICNRGDDQLYIDRVVVEDLEPQLELEPIEGVFVAPGDCVGFDLVYVPEACASVDSSVLVLSNDPDERTVVVPVRGQGLGGE